MKRRSHPPLLLYTTEDLNAMNGGPYVERFLSSIPAVAPNPFIGPSTVSGVGTPLELALDRDGKVARDSALAWRLGGKSEHLYRAAEFLLVWSMENTPTDYADCGDKWGGSYQSHGLFMFAHAYDLIRDAFPFTITEEALVRDWLYRSLEALETFVDKARTEYVMTHRTMRSPYAWDSTKTYLTLDNYVGGDNMAMVAVARYGIAKVLGRAVDESEFFAANIISRGVSPDNSGDGTVNPAPAVNVYKKPIAGRGGTIDYMTYNARVQTILNIICGGGFDPYVMDKTWSYLATFFDGTRAPFAPGDTINLNACLPRFKFAEWALGMEFEWLPDQWYYEPQFLGPVSVTCWRA